MAALIILLINATIPHSQRFLSARPLTHPALDATVRGIIDALATEGFQNTKNIIIKTESAQANPALAAQIASSFMGTNPTIVVGVGTMAAQAFLRYQPINKTKLVFSSITDPVGAGLVASDTKQKIGITGVSNFVPLEPQLTLFKKILPAMTRLGILYNPGEANSVSIVQKLEQLCPNFGLSLIKQTVTKTGDIIQNTMVLTTQTDALFVSNDNTVLSAIKTVVSVAEKQKIPVFVSDTDAVALGALAALGPNQYDIGQQTGRMIAQLLRDKNTADLAIEYPAKTELVINKPMAKTLGITLPENLS